MKKISLVIFGFILVNLSYGQTQNNFYTSLIAQLDTIHQEDQECRLRLDELLKKSRSESENVELITLIELIDEKDSLNLLKIERILDEYGWLGADVIGEQGNSTIFLVIQHSDLETQLKYLPMMREAVKKGNAKGKDFALLVDRIEMKQGNRQIYGSQIKTDGNEFYVYPIIDPEKVNERRAEVGLEPIEDYVKNVGVTWDVEKHKDRTKKIESQKEE
ncbi:DUF6624 domain-containing protein [uncultured Draconibacterium sp.]|uniref:DUF6624 domain-containing protein n=1 Tax=uncultured Draconibacterium sp. TaxID=1573823 RepID=UPI003216F54E